MYIYSTYLPSNLVLSHHYGQDGRDIKKISTRGLLLDFEFFQSLANEDFQNKLKSQISKFVNHLNENKSQGIYLIYFLISYWVKILF